MTTTEVPRGVDDVKPSSRVLRPPGGVSSFTLGMGPEEPQVQLPRQSASEAARGSAAQTPLPVTPDIPLAEGQSPSVRANTSSHSRIFGDSGPDPVTPTSGRDLTKGASAYNPITGAIYPGFERLVSDLEVVRFGKSPVREAAKDNGNPITGKGQQAPNRVNPAPTQPSTKVRQPPGGFCHGIF